MDRLIKIASELEENDWLMFAGGTYQVTSPPINGIASVSVELRVHPNVTPCIAMTLFKDTPIVAYRHP